MNLNILSILLLVLRIVCSTRIYLNSDRSLHNLLIFINDGVPEGDGSLIINIKRYLTEASKSLLRATNNLDPQKGGVQLGYSYIRIPMSWKLKYSDMETWQQCGNADIFISTKENNNNNKFDPFTKQTGSCGEPGEFTKYPHEFFDSQNDKYIKIKGNIMMDEFVKLRYGVFSEKPFKNMITYFNGYKFAQSTCGENIKLTLSKPPALCSIMDNDCKYSIEKGQTHSHSIMFDEETPTTSYFCDNVTHIHNKLAKSLQNIKCNQKSISDVILQHSDFQNKTKKINCDEPFFFIVKGSYRRIVLVIDSSGSMESKLDNVKEAAIEFIMNIVEDTAEVGLVTFNYNGEIKSELRSMKIIENKNLLKTAIKSLIAYGSTNIPDGLEKAMNVFNTSLNTFDEISGTIILLTDGENNEKTVTWDLLIPIELKKKAVIVHSISYGRDSDRNLLKIARVTGGRFIYADPKSSYSDLMSKFAIKTFCENPRKFSVKVMQESKTISNIEIGKPINLTYIDSYVGQNISITVTLKSNISKYIINIINPNNDLFIPSKTFKEEAGTTFTFKLPENTEIGIYKIILNSLSGYRTINESFLNNSDVNVYYTLSAIPHVTPRSIIPTGKLSNTDISQVDNFTSILVTIDMTTCQTSNFDKIFVNVSMNNPHYKVVEIIMNDNGVGGDSIEGDNVYSGMFYANYLNVEGYYTFQGKINILKRDSQYPIQRTVEIDSLFVKSSSVYPISDKISPAKINYFNIINSSSENKTLTLSFLSTGDDGLLGKISEYQINVYHDNNSTMLSKYAEVEPLQKIFINLNLENATSNQPFILKVRGVDHSRNYGEWSPAQIFSWNYKQIWDEYSKSGTSKCLMPKYPNVLLAMLLLLVINY